jgi:hypothetical protein
MPLCTAMDDQLKVQGCKISHLHHLELRVSAFIASHWLRNTNIRQELLETGRKRACVVYSVFITVRTIVLGHYRRMYAASL